MICPVERDLNRWIAEGEEADAHERMMEEQEKQILDGIRRKIKALGFPLEFVQSIVELLVCTLEDPASDAGKMLFDALKLSYREIAILEHYDTAAKQAAKKYREANRDYAFDNGDYFNGY